MTTWPKESQRLCENIRPRFPPGTDLTSGSRRRAADQVRVRNRMRNRGRVIVRLGSGLFGFRLSAESVEACARSPPIKKKKEYSTLKHKSIANQRRLT